MRRSDLGLNSSSADFVCARCVKDYALAEVVRNNLASEQCDFCGRTSKRMIAAAVDDVTEHIAECINREYSDPVDELPYESADGGYQGDVVDSWDLLEEIGLDVG